MAKVGDNLVCSQGLWGDVVDAYEYRPLRNGVPVQAFGSSNEYTLQSADEGALISFEVRVSNVAGQNSAFSASVGPVEPGADAGGGDVAPTITGSPSIAAIIQSGESATITPATVSGTPTPDVTYQVQTSDDNGVTWADSGSPFTPASFTPSYSQVIPDEVSVRIKQIATNTTGSAEAFSVGAEVILNVADLSPRRHYEPRISRAWVETSGQATLAGEGDPVGELEDLGLDAANIFAAANSNRPSRNGDDLDHGSDDYLVGAGLTSVHGGAAMTQVHVGYTRSTTTAFLSGGEGAGVIYSPATLRLGSGEGVRWYAETAADTAYSAATVTGIATTYQALMGVLDAAGGSRRYYCNDWATPIDIDTIAASTVDAGQDNYAIGARSSAGFPSLGLWKLDLIFAYALNATQLAQLRRYINYHHGV